MGVGYKLIPLYLSNTMTVHLTHLSASFSLITLSMICYTHPIGSYLGTLYCGGKGYYLSPISFLKDPNVWLKSISKFKGTHTQVRTLHITPFPKYYYFLLLFSMQ